MDSPVSEFLPKFVPPGLYAKKQELYFVIKISLKHIRKLRLNLLVGTNYITMLFMLSL